MNMKTKIILPLLILLMMVGIASAAVYSPTCSWAVGDYTGRDSPTANAGTLGGEMAFNVTWGSNNILAAGSNITQVAMEYRVTGGTWYMIGNKTIQTQVGINITNATIYNSTWATSATDLCYDSKTYELRTTIYNSSGGQPCTVAALTGLFCDNTKPQCSIGIPAASTTYTTGSTFLANTANASRNCKWTIGNVYAGTINGTAGNEDCYYDFGTGYPPEYNYALVSVTVADQTGNTTTCTAANVIIDDVTGTVVKKMAGGVGVSETTSKFPQGNNLTVLIIAIVAAIIFIQSRKKK